eukprot:362478-Chlamydomonas_euryale.AAC.15
MARTPGGAGGGVGQECGGGGRKGGGSGGNGGSMARVPGEPEVGDGAWMWKGGGERRRTGGTACATG